jgi:hypothetical protein
MTAHMCNQVINDAAGIGQVNNDQYKFEIASKQL